MTDPAVSGTATGAARPHAMPGTHRDDGADLSSAVYGSLLVTTLLAVQARAGSSPEFIAFTLLIGVGVFWLTEVWSEVVNHRVRGPITRSEVWRIGRDESPMLSAAIIPAAVLALASFGALSLERAIDVALVVGIVQLFAWGLAVGRAVNRGWGVALLIASVDCALGLLIVVLKVYVLH
jgi:hypothetical protein